MDLGDYLQDPFGYKQFQLVMIAEGYDPTFLFLTQTEVCNARAQAVNHLKDGYYESDPNVAEAARNSFLRDCPAFAAKIQQSPPATLATSVVELLADQKTQNSSSRP